MEILLLKKILKNQMKKIKIRFVISQMKYMIKKIFQKNLQFKLRRILNSMIKVKITTKLK